MSLFDIKFINYEDTSENIALIVRKEMQGTGKYVGYRAMTKTIRQLHCMGVQSDVNAEVLVECKSLF